MANFIHIYCSNLANFHAKASLNRILYVRYLYNVFSINLKINEEIRNL